MQLRLLLILALIPMFGYADEAKKNYLKQFVQSSYQLRGKLADSGKIYVGTAIIKLQDGGLRITKTIDGKVVTSSAVLEPVASDLAVFVLRFPFDNSSGSYVQTCSVAATLENQPTLDCVIHPKDSDREMYGIEELKPNPQ